MKIWSFDGLKNHASFLGYKGEKKENLFFLFFESATFLDFFDRANDQIFVLLLHHCAANCI